MSEEIKEKTIQMIGKAIDEAVSIGAEVSLKVLSVLVDRFDDYSVPDMPHSNEEFLKEKEDILAGLQKDPTDAYLHYKMAMYYHLNFEYALAKMEYEIADMINPLQKEKKDAYNQLLLDMKFISEDKNGIFPEK